MSRTVSATFKKAVFAQETTEAFICLLTISHPSFTQDVLLTDDPTQLLPVAGVRGIISNGVEFLFLPFTFQLPAQNDSETAKATITIDNVSQEIIKQVRSANSAVSLKIQIVLSSTPDVIDFEADNFQLNNVTYDALTVSGDLSLDYFDLEPYPAPSFTPSYFPGLF